MMPIRIYLIAGEASGDFLGAQLMRALKEHKPDIKFFGVGGSLMEAEGLSSLFPMEDLSVMGISEVLPRLPLLIKRIRQTTKDIITREPFMVVSIDAPDFSFRVQKKIRAYYDSDPMARPRQIHYVAPTVWAWRPKRAKKIAAFLDAQICLFDFEPPYFEKEGLKAIGVGHPMMESGLQEAKPLQIGEEKTKKLGVFFGSRQGEIKRVSPVILDALQNIIMAQPDIELIVPTLPHLKDQIAELMSGINVPIHIIAPSLSHSCEGRILDSNLHEGPAEKVNQENVQNKWSVFKSCDAAIAVSGTVGLELAACGVPHLIAYKMNAMTARILKRVVRVRYAHLANIMQDKEIVPEFIQDNCRAEKISQKALSLLMDDGARQSQLSQFDAIRRRIGGDKSPSIAAAEFLLSLK